MSTIEEVGDALKILTKSGTPLEKITVLHCNTEYPTSIEDVNLKAMHTIRDTYGVKVGYSDHTMGIEIPIAAVAMGAIIIEKHFTLNREMKGPDHKASLEPSELNAMVKAIRKIEKALGDGIKRPSRSESKNIHIVRKYLVAKTKIQKGDIFTKDNITAKRIGYKGISPMQLDRIIGTKAKKDFEADEALSI
jgi:N,N'-diacetyllegionaminate synthase